MELTIITKMGEKELLVKGIMLDELIQVCSWGGYKNKAEWIQAFNDEQPLALQAGYALAVWRETKQKPKLAELNFDTDTVDSRMVDETGQTVELVFETNEDGTLKLTDSKPVPSLNDQGRLQFRYTESGELVPTEGAQEATSPTPRKRGSSSGSASSTPTSEPS